MARTCPACGTRSDSDTARFCGSCGGRMPDAAAEVPTVMERIGPVTRPSAAPESADLEAVQFTALCPSCGAANPPDTVICEFCGEEIPVEQRRRRTAVFGALGAAGSAGVAGGILTGQGGGALSGMAGSGGALSGGSGGGALSGLGSGQPALSGLGQSPPGGVLSGMGGQPANLNIPPPPAGAGSGMGAPGMPSGGSGMGSAAPPPVTGNAPPIGPGDAAAVAPPPAPPAPPPAPSSPPSFAQPASQPSLPPMPSPDGGSGIGGMIVKGVLTAGGILGGAAIGAVVLGGILVFTGDPAPCVERVSTPSNEAVTGLFAKWNQFQVDAQGGPATVAFDETEATSRAQQYLDEKGIPLENAQVYFCPNGRGQVKGQVAALGRDINILLEGRVDATQDPPVIVIDEIKAGNLPSAVAETIVADRLDRNDVKTLNFGVPNTAVNVSDGGVVIESPGP
jgi:predicted nucleic acid-binding Zn ribbon protein